MIPISDSLARSPLLQGLSREEVFTILSEALQLRWRPGVLVYGQGETARQFFLLEAGRVRLDQVTAVGDEVLLRFVTPGDIFGSRTLVEDSTYMLSATAVQDSCAVGWDRGTIRQLMYKYPRLALNASGIAVDWVAELGDRYVYLATKTVEQRIAKELAQLATRIGTRSDRGDIISGGFFMKDLASLAGTTIYSVSRVLGEWQRRGLIERGRGRITVLDVEALQRFTGT